MNKDYVRDQVDIITVHYNAEEILPQFFDSLKKVTYEKITITMVDNASPDGSVTFTRENYPDVQIIQMDKNYFFAKSNNRGIKETNGEFILLINNDIVVEPGFLEPLIAQMRANTSVAAVASKMILSQFEGMFDSAGTVILDNGEAFNRGIGQPDIDQYESGQTFGACFGCVLLRREHLDTIGLLDEHYFGYYEDVDWNYRANLMGYKIMYAPESKVYHAHSMTARKNAQGTPDKKWKPSKKHYLIRRNFLWTIQKNYSAWQAVKITYVRYRNMLREGFKRRELLKTNITAVLVNLATLPRTLWKRWKIQRQRKVADKDIVQYAHGEVSFFDGDAYEPVYTLDNLEYALKKATQVNPDMQLLFDAIKEANNTKFPEDQEWIDKTHKVLDKLKGIIPGSQIEAFRKHILIDQTWFKPKMNSER